MKHVIIEGSDGAGKTTLARWICHKHVMDYHHEGVPPSGNLLHHYAGLLANATRPTVFDRLHLGELVYGPLLRGQSGLAPSELELMNRLVRGTGTMIVLCSPPWETCHRNTQHRHELIEDKIVMRAAYDGWRVIASRRDVGPKQIHDYTHSEFSLIERPSLPDGVIGDTEARALFVGEQSNSGTLDLAFFGTERSSGYLNDRIKEAGFVEHELAFTNALDIKGHARDLPFIISQMPHLEVVITLGRTASNQLQRQGAPTFVRVHDLPHPQYWKRFHASAPQEYTLMLARTYAA